MKKRRGYGRVLGVGVCAAWCAMANAQTPPPPAVQPPPPSQAPTPPEQPGTKSIPAPANATDALDRALGDLRIAESEQGPQASEAFERAVAYIGYVLERDPANLRAKYYQARVYVLRNRASEAISRLIDWTKSGEGKNDWEGHYILGRVYISMEFPKLAEPMLESAATLNPREARVIRLLSQCKAKLLKKQEALDRANQFLQMLGADADAEAVLVVAEALVLNDRLDDAEKTAVRAHDMALEAVRKDSTNVRALTLSDAAIKMLMSITQTRLKTNLDAPELYLRMSTLLQEQAGIAVIASNNTSLRWAYEALRKSQNNPSEPVIAEMVKLLALVGKSNDARALGEKGLQRFPNSVEINKAMATLKPPTETPPEINADDHGR